MFRYVRSDPLARRDPTLRPDFVVMQRGQTLAVLDAKYRDLWSQPLPREMLYQLALYALGRANGERLSAILYPTANADAREQVISIQEPVHGKPQAQVALRPVNLILLEQYLREDQAKRRERARFARELAFGSPASLPAKAIH